MFKSSLKAIALSSTLILPMTAVANGSEHNSDIVDIAAGNEAFSTLVAAVTAAGLVDTLKGEGPFTVFAPTDEAFAALPEGTVEALLEDIPALTAILTYHVVPGAIMSGDLSEGCTEVETVNGASATVCAAETVTIDGATVVQADIEATNGVIHVIDAVILPE
ncbi:MAG: fasciclin domain-containing protein [Rhodobacteraceae bacterium]|nr:MAG: fasciclin domain-containing protein [Paracoccaceae bacterium]